MHLKERAHKWLPWLLLAVAVLITAGVYWPGVSGGWVFDDYPNIIDNAAIHITRGDSTLVAWLNSALSSPSSFLHRPLASLTFSANWYFGNGNPWPFKVTNIVIHLINGVLVFCMLRALLRLVGWRHHALPPSPSGRGAGGEGSGFPKDIARTEPSPGAPRPPLPEGEGKSAAIDDTAATRLALIVSAAWMLLPINLMAVLYVVQRMESLCQIFVLAGLWTYLHGRWMMLTATDAGRDRRGFALAIAGIVFGTVLGLTSKETGVLLPVFAFLAEWIVLRFARAVPANNDRGLDHPQLVIPGRPAGSNPTAFAGLQTRTPKAARSATAKDGASQSVSLTPTAQPACEPDEAQETDSGSPLRDVRNDNKSQPFVPARQDKRLWAFFIVTLFIPAILGFAWLLRGALRPGALAGREFTLAQRLLTEPRVLVDYLHWTLFPDPMVLSLYHDEIQVSTGLLTPWTTLGAMLLLAALIVVAIWLRNRRPLVSLGIGWFFAAQLLTATIIPLELVYEQRMYFASIGVLLAAGALLLGLRWKIALPLLRGFVVAVALLWFAVATNLRAHEWSNPLRLAVAEANRHPESARAVYEAGRLLLIASNYQPGKTLDESWKYLRKAAAIPGSSALADQAMIMIADHHREGADDTYWDSMVHKLRDQPTRQEDISALISLTSCYKADICKFDVAQLQRAYEAALSRPHPIARLNGAYADFQRDIMHNDKLAEVYLARAVAGDPDESAYRIDLAALYARNGQIEEALQQIDALRHMNLAGRLDGQIATLERLAKQDGTKSQ
ncbi:MAG TPA: tetratricopeptide repeat protein [Rhodanobacteraceae bacterium]|nr:tetratricopeptide repeat protein [Rhodanobacteraceae bacterium]